MMLFVQKYGQFQRFHIQYFILPVWLLKSYPIESWSLRQGRRGKVQRVKDIVLKLRYWGTCLDCSQSQATATQSPKQLLGWWGLNGLPWFWGHYHPEYVCMHSWLCIHLQISSFPSLQLVKTADLDSRHNYILGFHPHGVLVAGAFTNFCTYSTGFRQLFPGITSYLLMLPLWFRAPFFRDYIMCGGLSYWHFNHISHSSFLCMLK